MSPNSPTWATAQNNGITSARLMLCAYAYVYWLRSSRKYSQTDAVFTSSLWSGDEPVFVMSEVRQAATDQVDEL